MENKHVRGTDHGEWEKEHAGAARKSRKCENHEEVWQACVDEIELALGWALFGKAEAEHVERNGRGEESERRGEREGGERRSLHGESVQGFASGGEE
eukprot:3565496-Pleurochrysis_carterae.AAC.2